MTPTLLLLGILAGLLFAAPLAYLWGWKDGRHEALKERPHALTPTDTTP